MSCYFIVIKYATYKKMGYQFEWFCQEALKGGKYQNWYLRCVKGGILKNYLKLYYTTESCREPM